MCKQLVAVILLIADFELFADFAKVSIKILNLFFLLSTKKVSVLWIDLIFWHKMQEFEVAAYANFERFPTSRPQVL